MVLHVLKSVLYIAAVWLVNETLGTLNDNDTHIMIIPSRINGCKNTTKPHIIIFLADDLGWNDVSFHGSNQIPTPNIDAIAYNGIILNSHYVGPSCTSTRASLLTGKYPIHLGLQHGEIVEGEPRGLNLTEQLLPEYLRYCGYKTHAIGKWQLGFFHKDYIPINRGFDSHYGPWTGHQDYYTHISVNEKEHWSGYDMRDNANIDWSSKGLYSTDLFTSKSIRIIENHNKSLPLFLYISYLSPHAENTNEIYDQSLSEDQNFTYIEDDERRSFAVKVSKLDQSIGQIMESLHENQMLDNSIILFLSDNGAPTIGANTNGGSNFPLRGIKGGPWEGSLRTTAAIWSPLLKKVKYVEDKLISVVDWFPTLLDAAGLNINNLENTPIIDGINLWPLFSGEKESQIRIQLLLNIDEISNYSAIRYNEFKMITGKNDKNTEWYGDSGRNLQENMDTKFPAYSPGAVLQSKSGIAITEVIKSQSLKFSVNNKENAKLLSAADIHVLRFNAIIHCNNSQELVKCNSTVEPCIFNIKVDPCELNNIAPHTEIAIEILEALLYEYEETLVPASNVEIDPKANPLHWNQTWTSWMSDTQTVVLFTKNIIISLVVLSLLLLIIICVIGRKYTSYHVLQAAIKAGITEDKTRKSVVS